jgi:hypothetical protein
VKQEVLRQIKEWVEQANNATREAFCGHCDEYRPIQQREVDEVCCYVCLICGRVIDPLATPF